MFVDDVKYSKSESNHFLTKRLYSHKQFVFIEFSNTWTDTNRRSLKQQPFLIKILEIRIFRGGIIFKISTTI